MWWCVYVRFEVSCVCMLTTSSKLTLAPLLRSSCTISTLPCSDATIRGVCPFWKRRKGRNCNCDFWTHQQAHWLHCFPCNPFQNSQGKIMAASDTSWWFYSNPNLVQPRQPDDYPLMQYGLKQPFSITQVHGLILQMLLFYIILTNLLKDLTQYCLK